MSVAKDAIPLAVCNLVITIVAKVMGVMEDEFVRIDTRTVEYVVKDSQTISNRCNTCHKNVRSCFVGKLVEISLIG